MKRGIFGLGILALFLILGLLGAKVMEDFHTPLAHQLEQAATLALRGDLEDATRLAEDVHRRWDRKWDQVAILADHTPMDQIDATFARLEAYGQAGNIWNFAALCRDLSAQISATAEAHKLSWRNLL